MNSNQPATGRLQMGTVAHPTRSEDAVPFFRHWRSACEHLRDHLLTAPECRAWQLVSPAYARVVNPDDADARWSYVQRAMASEGRAAQPLYDLYRAAVSQDTGDSIFLGWCRGGHDTTVCLGTSGILAVFDQRSMRTAFLPGQGDAGATRTGREVEQPSGLPREGGMRSGRPGRRDRRAKDRDRRARERREAAWSRTERLYYRVFKPAVQFVKRCHHRHRNMYGDWLRGDYALLKDVLPNLSQLKYEHWLELRARCGRNEPALPASPQAEE